MKYSKISKSTKSSGRKETVFKEGSSCSPAGKSPPKPKKK